MASLADIVKGIQETNDLLTDNVKANERVQTLMADQARDADAARMDALGAVKKSKSATKTSSKGNIKGFGSGFKQGIGAGALEGWGTALIGALFSGVAGAGLIGSITGLFGLALGKIVFTGATIGLVAAFGEKVIEKLFETLDPNEMVMDKDAQKKIGQSITRAAILGLAAAVFGKKLGLAVFAGSLVTDAINNYLLSEDSKKKMSKPFMEAFGLEITPNAMTALGMGIAGLFGIPAIFSALTYALTGQAAIMGKGKNPKVGKMGPLKPRLLSGFSIGMGARLGLAGGIGLLGMAYGGVISDAVAKLVNYKSGPDKPRFNDDVAKAMGDASGITLTATAMGFALGGPWGALVGAIIGGTIGLYKILKTVQDDLNAKALETAMHKQRGFKEEFFNLSLEDQKGNPGLRLQEKIKGVDLQIQAERIRQRVRNDPTNRNNETLSAYADALALEGSTLIKSNFGRFFRNDTYQHNVAATNASILSGAPNLNELMFDPTSLGKAGVQSNIPDFLRIGTDRVDLPTLRNVRLKSNIQGIATAVDAGLMKFFTTVGTAMTGGAPTVVDASTKDMSTHQQVHMLPAVRPATIDTSSPQFIMMYGQRAMSPFGGM